MDIPFAFLTSLILAGAALVQSLIFAAILLGARFRGVSGIGFLAAAILLLAAVKADELFQLLDGPLRWPAFAFLLAPLQPLLTPALYFFVRARSDAEFRLARRHLVHLLPALLFAAYWMALFLGHDVDTKRSLIESGALSSPVHALWVPILFDLVQLAYLAAAYHALNRHGLALRQWFSRVEDKSLSWLRPVLLIWSLVFAVHLARLMAGAWGVKGVDVPAILLMDVGHLVLVNYLFLAALAEFTRRADPVEIGKYAGSTLSQSERESLYEAACTKLGEAELHRDSELTLADLAEALSATPRELSEAINGVGGESYYAFVNRHRVESAKRMLRGTEELRIIDVAMAAGFGSKSSFHDHFVRLVGVTPTRWREGGGKA